MSEKTKNSYRKDMERAYNSGFRAGWAAHEEIPRRFGSRSAARVGFSNGLRAHKKTDKYTSRSKK